MTQQELAKEIGTTQSAIARLESGFSTPSLKTLKQIGEVFDLEVRIHFYKSPEFTDVFEFRE